MSNQIPYLNEKLSVPQNEIGEPVFKAPWESRTLAMTLTLLNQGQYAWEDFRALLAAEFEEHGQDESYYELWLESFEALLMEKQIFTPQELESRMAELGQK